MNHNEIEHMVFALACLNLFQNKHLLELLKFVWRKKCFCGLCFLEWWIEKVPYIILVKQKASLCCLFKKGLVE